MRSTEALSLKKAIDKVFGWIFNRKIKVNAGLYPSPDQGGVVFQLVFPDFKFSNAESEFFGREKQVFSLNGSTPPTFRDIESAQNSLRQIGGHVVLTKIGESTMALGLYIPTDKENPTDVAAKLRLIVRELREILHTKS